MRSILIWVMIFWGFAFSAQSLSGIVNNYYPATSINQSEATITVTNTTGLAIGDTLLLIQMKGAQIDLSNSDAYGDVLDYGGAGNFELTEVCDIQGNEIVLKTQLEKQYTAEGLQLVSFASNADVETAGKAHAAANGVVAAASPTAAPAPA